MKIWGCPYILVFNILFWSNFIKDGGFPKFNIVPLRSFDGDRYEVQLVRCSYLVKRIGVGSGEVGRCQNLGLSDPYWKAHTSWLWFSFGVDRPHNDIMSKHDWMISSFNIEKPIMICFSPPNFLRLTSLLPSPAARYCENLSGKVFPKGSKGLHPTVMIYLSNSWWVSQPQPLALVILIGCGGNPRELDAQKPIDLLFVRTFW